MPKKSIYVAGMAVTKKKKRGRGRPPSPKTDLTPQHHIAFMVTEKVHKQLEAFAKRYSEHLGEQVSVHAFTKRLVSATALVWARQVEEGKVDLQDPDWEPPF